MQLSKNIGSEKKDLQFWIRYPIRRKNQLPEIRLKADIQSLENYQYQWQNQKASGTLTNLVGNLIHDQIKPYWKEHYPDDPTKKFEAALRSGFFIVFHRMLPPQAAVGTTKPIFHHYLFRIPVSCTAQILVIDDISVWLYIDSYQGALADFTHAPRHARPEPDDNRRGRHPDGWAAHPAGTPASCARAAARTLSSSRISVSPTENSIGGRPA